MAKLKYLDFHRSCSLVWILVQFWFQPLLSRLLSLPVSVSQFLLFSVNSSAFDPCCLLSPAFGSTCSALCVTSSSKCCRKFQNMDRFLKCCYVPEKLQGVRGAPVKINRGKNKQGDWKYKQKLREIQPQININLRRQKHTMDYTNSTLLPKNGGRVQVPGVIQDTERHTTQLSILVIDPPNFGLISKI